MGVELKLARTTLGWSRERAAAAAGVARSTLARIEGGDPRVRFDLVCAVGAAVGVDVVLRAYPAEQPGLRDTGQLEIANHLVGVAHPSWQPALEVPCGEHGEAADLVLFGARGILHVEIERVMVDLQAQLRRATLKRDRLQVGESRPVALVMVVEDTERNRRTLAPHTDLIRRALPAGQRAVRAALASGQPPATDGLLWIRRSRLEHRPIPEPNLRHIGRPGHDSAEHRSEPGRRTREPQVVASK